jgi:hypothetical protein
LNRIHLATPREVPVRRDGAILHDESLSMATRVGLEPSRPAKAEGF